MQAFSAPPWSAFRSSSAVRPTKAQTLRLPSRTARSRSRRTEPPGRSSAWVRFCEQFPAECAVNASEPRTVELTPQVWNTIVAVNRRVNGKIKPITDKEHWGLVDRWEFPDDGMGDCEDFQLLKRRLLVERGLPRRAMRMTVVIDELGEGHAVLMVRTDRGDYILDNKTSAVLPWNQTGYVYRQAREPGRHGLGVPRRPDLADHDRKPLRPARVNRSASGRPQSAASCPNNAARSSAAARRPPRRTAGPPAPARRRSANCPQTPCPR